MRTGAPTGRRTRRLLRRRAPASARGTWTTSSTPSHGGCRGSTRRPSSAGVLSLREDRSTERNYWLGDDEPGVEVRADFVLGAEPSGESEARLTVYVNGRPVEVESEGVPVTHVDVRTVDGRAGADLLLPRDLFVSGGSTVHLLAFWEYSDHPSYAPFVTSVAFLVYRESELPLETFEADRTTRPGDTSDRRAGLPHHASYIWANEPTRQDRTPAADAPIMVRMQPNPGLETCRPYTEVQSLIVLANGLPLDGWAPGDAGSSYVVAHEAASGAVDVEVRIPERILEAERTALNFMVLGGIGAPLQNTVHSGYRRGAGRDRLAESVDDRGSRSREGGDGVHL